MIKKNILILCLLSNSQYFYAPTPKHAKKNVSSQPQQHAHYVTQKQYTNQMTPVFLSIRDLKEDIEQQNHILATQEQFSHQLIAAFSSMRDLKKDIVRQKKLLNKQDNDIADLRKKINSQNQLIDRLWEDNTQLHNHYSQLIDAQIQLYRWKYRVNQKIAALQRRHKGNYPSVFL